MSNEENEVRTTIINFRNGIDRKLFLSVHGQTRFVSITFAPNAGLAITAVSDYDEDLAYDLIQRADWCYHGVTIKPEGE